MGTNYDSLDIIYTFNGDYQISTDGDFADTQSDQIQSLIQEVQTICNSDANDWQENPNYAATVDDFVGEPNNRQTAQSITDRIKTSLTANNVVRANDLSIQTIPINKYELLIIISINAASTPNNSVPSNGTTVVTFVYDYLEQGISFVDNFAPKT